MVEKNSITYFLKKGYFGKQSGDTCVIGKVILVDLVTAAGFPDEIYNLRPIILNISWHGDTSEPK